MMAMFQGKPIFGPRGPAGPDGNPIGTIITYMGISAPNDYLICDGTVYNIADYSKLAEVFKNQFGSENYFGGDGITTFAVPNISITSNSTIQCIKATVSKPYDDIYSTEETRIGTWIDEKPIYRKVVQFPALTAVAQWGIIYVDELNIDLVINMFGQILALDDYAFVIPGAQDFGQGLITMLYKHSEKCLSAVTNSRNWLNTPFSIILEYTKTTD